MTEKYLSKFLFALTLLFILASFLCLPHPTFANNSLAPNNNPASSGEIDSVNFNFDLNVITDPGIAGSVRQNWIRGGVNYFFGRIIGFLAGVAGGVAVLIMTYGGFLILSSAGDEDQYGKGLDYIKYAAIGLAATLSAYILVNAVQLLIRSIYA